MNAGSTLLIYLLLGGVVAMAMRLRDRADLATFGVWIVFWPFLAPLLFTPPPPPDAQTDVITVARADLRAAVAELPASTRALLADEVERVLTLTDGMARLAVGIADMDAVLATPSFDATLTAETLEALIERGCEAADPRVISVQTRLANIEQLHKLRARRAADLERALLTLQALTSEVRLLACAFLGRGEVPEAIAQVTALVRALAEGLFAPDEALV